MECIFLGDFWSNWTLFLRETKFDDSGFDEEAVVVAASRGVLGRHIGSHTADKRSGEDECLKFLCSVMVLDIKFGKPGSGP